ncbi:baseplate J/gp47 family protein, partial [Candidatus Pacearchaeota archaeon]|nr:baseplate J/gp47 family protein [Candidatus Pacearchaeota archaeon]
MANVTDTGITPTTLSEYQTLLRTAFKTAFGENIDVDAKSPQGQFIDNMALSMSQSDDAIISVGGVVNIFRAFKSQLEGLAALLGINKNEAESTIVIVTLGGTPATIVTAGSRARSDAGDLYELDEDTQLDGGGIASATMSAIETGPIELLTGELTSVVDVVPGWETVVNPSDGVTGRDIESDSVYRQRYFTELFRNALSVLDAMNSVISEQDNVVEVVGYENDTDASIVVQNISIDPHSIAMVVEGGLDQDI